MKTSMRSLIATLLVGAQTAAALYTNGSVIAPCDSPLYCYGDLLREVELARPFADSKLFVDLPTIRPLDEVLAAFRNLSRPVQNNTALTTFLLTYFGQAGSELEALPEDLAGETFFESEPEDRVVSKGERSGEERSNAE